MVIYWNRGLSSVLVEVQEEQGADLVAEELGKEEFDRQGWQRKP